MEEALMELMLADTDLTALVGTRIHWDALPERVSGRPYIALTVITAPDAYHHEGVANWQQWEIQFDIWGDTASDTILAERAVRNLLSGYRGAVSGIEFQGIFIDRARGDGIAGTGGDGQLHRRSLDLNISWAKE